MGAAARHVHKRVVVDSKEHQPPFGTAAEALTPAELRWILQRVILEFSDVTCWLLSPKRLPLGRRQLKALVSGCRLKLQCSSSLSSGVDKSMSFRWHSVTSSAAAFPSQRTAVREQVRY